MRENDLRDCVNDLACRWQDAFQRANVRLDIQIHRRAAAFKFDYQKVQQCIANLLDNALKHTPAGGMRHAARGAALLGAADSPKQLRPTERRRGAWQCAEQRAGFGDGHRQRESPRSFIRKFSRSSCASIHRRPGWVWAWRSPSA